MEAIRETLDVLGNAITIRLPASFSARRVEVIVLPVAEEDSPPHSQRRRHRPSADLAGTIIRDDLLEPATSADDWDALK